MAPATPHVAVLLASFNGAAYLAAQARSILAQSWQNLSLWISDDGSTDGTQAIVAQLAAHHPDRQIRLLCGPGKGSTRNFLSLICDRRIEADLVALADQDDLWFPQKVARAMAALGPDPAAPRLYGARTTITDALLRPVGPSPLFRAPPGFGNALVQNIAGGNTMVLNRAARDLVCAAGPQVSPVCHDWWLYQLVTGAGGVVVYDPEPVLYYRQHGRNLVGANISVAARMRRMCHLASGRFAAWNAQNLLALHGVRHMLDDAALDELEQFAALRRLRGGRAMRALARSGIRRQTWAGQMSLMVAAASGLL